MPEHISNAAAWFEAATGSGVVRSGALLGGLSSDVERHWLADYTSVVTRTISNTAWLETEPDLIEREARALTILASSPLETPRLIAADQPSAHLAMSFLDGVLEVDRNGLAPRSHAMAAAAAAIAAVPLPRAHGLPEWRAWVPADPQPPTWGDAPLWRRGIDAYRAVSQPTTDDNRLLHRDLHPLNVLWSEQLLPAVVDWVNACVGHPHAELGHLRAPVLSHLPGPIGCGGWHAIGRTDLTHDIVVERTHQFVESALDRA